jgi:hypothetical protein
VWLFVFLSRARDDSVVDLAAIFVGLMRSVLHRDVHSPTTEFIGVNCTGPLFRIDDMTDYTSFLAEKSVVNGTTLHYRRVMCGGGGVP